MKNPHPDTQTIFMTRPEGLARLLNLDEAGRELWNPAEMQAMWRHQLDAPIDYDLDTVVSVKATDLRSSPALKPFRGKAFAEVLNHPAPPVELLLLIKEFAKQTLKDAEEMQLKEVAKALYYSSYALALVRCRQSLGSMTEQELLPGFDWGLKQPWLDENTRNLFAQARPLVASSTA
jgi:hypothetical protein